VSDGSKPEKEVATMMTPETTDLTTSKQAEKSDVKSRPDTKSKERTAKGKGKQVSYHKTLQFSLLGYLAILLDESPTSEACWNG